MISADFRADDLFEVKLHKHSDLRGCFIRAYDRESLSSLLLGRDLPRLDYTYVSYNDNSYTLRGFHYQASPYSQWKQMTCISGSCQLQVINPTVKEASYSFHLSHQKPSTIIVGDKYATAFLTLEPNTIILYNVSGVFTESAGKVIRWDSPDWAISWSHKPIVMSDKDRTASL